MKSIKNILLLLLLTEISYAQMQYTYTAFNGKKEVKSAFVGRETVLLMPIKYKTKDSVIIKLLNVVDAFYDTYNQLANKPGGGNPDFNNKLSIAFVEETCGAGCGIVGSKGVEFGLPTADEIYDEIKTSVSRSRVAIISYEMGRNFFNNYGDKIQFIGTEANGGFAEQFAGYFAVEGLRNSILYTESYRNLNEAFFHLGESYYLGKAWTLDTTAKVETHLQRVANQEIGKIFDPNRNQRLLNFHTYFAGGILSIIDSVVGKGFMPRFWNEVGKLKSAKSNQDIINNIAIAASKAANCNLSDLFLDFFRFKIDTNTISALSLLPRDKKILNKFIKDKPILYFNNLRDSIKIDIRIIDRRNQNISYSIKINDSIFNSNKNGIFLIHALKVFKNCYHQTKPFFREELKCYALEDNKIIDSQYIIIGYRDSLSLKDHIKDLYIESSNNFDKISFDTSSNIITMQKIDTALDWSGLSFQYYPYPNKIYTFKGQAKADWTSAVNFNPDGTGLGNGRETYFRLSYLARLGGWSDARIGLDVHIPKYEIRDTSKWFDISYTIVTDSAMYLPRYLDQLNDPQAFNFKFAISFEQAPGIKRVQFRNMSIIDESLKKDIIDNIILEPLSLPILDTSICKGSVIDTQIVKAKPGNYLQWYEVSQLKKISRPFITSDSIRTYKYVVSQISNLVGCESPKSAINIIIKPLPNKPFITVDSSTTLKSSYPYGNKWYRENKLLSDTTSKIKVSESGIYTLKIKIYECESAVSDPIDLILTSKVELNKIDYIKFYPNPAIDQISVDYNLFNNSQISATILDYSGRIIRNFKSINSGELIQLTSLQKGIYIIKIYSKENKLIDIKKLLKV